MKNRRQHSNLLAVLVEHLVLWVVVCHVPSGIAFAKEKNTDPKLESYALLMGMCFDEKGFGAQGVTITVQLQVPPNTKSKVKKWLATTDARGEFAFRLPAGKNQFWVRATRKGYRPLEKLVNFTGDERQDVLFNMEILSRPH
jgi:hypothetical protein